MKLIYTLSALLISAATFAQITVGSAVVPQYMQGNSTTNNNRVAIYFWADISSLTPGATYRYYTSVDTLNSSPTSNGAGNPYLINKTSGTIRRTTNPTLTNSAGHDSIVASNTGTYSGWFAVEPTGNSRFAPGTFVHPQIQFNNGSGGTAVATRLKFLSYMLRVINFGTTSGSPIQGSALYDTCISPAKSFAVLFDNQTGTGRPINIGIVEDDGNDVFNITSIANFYRTLVDTVRQTWGVIIPNNLPSGIQRVEYRDFLMGQLLMANVDDNGIWCSLTNTINPANGGTAQMLDEWFVLTGNGSANLDTAQVLQNVTFTATSNDNNATYTWSFGDASPNSTSNPATHSYNNNGWFYYSVTITNGECYQVISDSIFITGTVGEVDIADDFVFTVFPNPANDFLTLTTNAASSYCVLITDVVGKTHISEMQNQPTATINLQHLANGVYLISIIGSDKLIGVKKLIVQH